MCCDTFSSMPTASIDTNIDEPPALTNGSGRPLLGSTPSTTLMLIERLRGEQRGQAERQERAEVSGIVVAML